MVTIWLVTMTGLGEHVVHGVREGSSSMGMLWDIIQHHMDTAPYPPSERQVARKLGVGQSVLTNWRDGLRRLPTRENLQAIADLVGVRYSVVLDAALHDTGYHEGATVTALRPRPASTVEAELRLAEEELADWRELNVSGKVAEGERAERQSRVDALRAELVASRSATGGSGSVARS
jgi:transcriptional regulator with XRE-family HTH domain